ncbi:MAG: cob(I)yrinic acid a,c-diamide adenosyltransferase [Lentisphaeraceae bacterium]|nr:cob(I)yrinic acid a,c-diamide adenosyltransferase [Lentisphaeraceae bacterium]
MSDTQHKEERQQRQTEQRQKLKEKQISRGIIIVNTGPGKGKSTAAFGTVMRAVGHGYKVGIVQFIKGKWATGEQKIFKMFDEITHVVSGDGFTWNTQDKEQDVASAQKGWQVVKEMIEAARADESTYKLLVLDELNIALRYEYIDINEVVDALKNKPENLNIMVTGRNAKDELIEIADTVTEMTLVKHAFEGGIKAQKGIEF